METVWNKHKTQTNVNTKKDLVFSPCQGCALVATYGPQWLTFWQQGNICFAQNLNTGHPWFKCFRAFELSKVFLKAGLIVANMLIIQLSALSCQFTPSNWWLLARYFYGIKEFKICFSYSKKAKHFHWTVIIERWILPVFYYIIISL